ncbi:MAG TPA: hypothetical protein VMX17_13255 [Candidatus Glassbacteria bacterium]|nr:hypothetical protein [Candidatus Glassbacteria bacterium]
MKILPIIIILGIFGCSGDSSPYRIIQMENEEYVIQYKAVPSFGCVGWVTYVDASGSYRFDNRFDAGEAYSRLVDEYMEKKRANKVKEILKP